MARKKPVSGTKAVNLIADVAVEFAEYAAKALVVAEELGIKAKAVRQFPLEDCTLASCTSTFRRRWGGPTRICTTSSSASSSLATRRGEWVARSGLSHE